MTQRAMGHTLNRRQVLSPDRLWCVYDTRNQDPEIGITRSIERLHLGSGQIETLYVVPKPTPFGPGVGAVAHHPRENRLAFIHGLLGCNEEHPYGIARRFGALLNTSTKELHPLESRFSGDPIPLGGLSGGTHAHSWSPSGIRMSFTYNDSLCAERGRTVGVSYFDIQSPVSIDQSGSGSEQFTGVAASFLLQHCDAHSPFSQALEECWVGNDHIAFLAEMRRDSRRASRLEIFVAKIPDEATVKSFLSESTRHGIDHVSVQSPNSSNGAPSIAPLVTIELRTDLSDRKYPGIQGPRHWLVADPKGHAIFSLWKDERGQPQLIRVAFKSGVIEQLTDLEFGIEGQISLSQDGEAVAFVASGKIHWLETRTGILHLVNESEYVDALGKTIGPPKFASGYIGAPHFIDRYSWLINRYVDREDGSFLQILKVQVSG